MASLVQNNTMLISVTGSLNLTEGQDDIRVALLMTNTTADTEEEVALMNGFTTLDECDGANYVRKTLSSQAVGIDTVNDRVEFDCEDITWTALGNGTRPIQGAEFLKHVTDDTDSIPLFFVDFDVDQSPGGSNWSLLPNAEGVLQISQGA